MAAPKCRQQHQGVSLGGGPGKRAHTQEAPTRPVPGTAQNHNQRVLVVAILVPPVHGQLGPWGLLKVQEGLCLVFAAGSGHSAGVWGSSLGQQLGHVSEGSYGWMGEEEWGPLASSTPRWV